MCRGSHSGESIYSTYLRAMVLGAAFLLVACGGDSSSTNSNPPQPATTTPPPPAATGPLQPVVAKMEVIPVPLNVTDIDRFLGVATDPKTGNVFAVGFRMVTATDSEIVVAKFNAQGNLDPTFGLLGIASVNVTPGGNNSEIARGLAVQSDGKVVVAGVAQHDIGATAPFNLDTDVVVARFNTNGTLDTTFGNATPTPNGIARLDLSTGVQTSPTAVRGDNSWGMVVLPNDKILVSTAKVTSASGRNDNDYAAVQLTKDGILDNTFGVNNNGIAEVDVKSGNDQMRFPIVQRTGTGPNDYKIVVSGHTNAIPGTSVVLVVLYRLLANGTFDATFNGTCAAEAAPCATGIIAAKYRPGTSEAYDVGLQSGDRPVFCGYGDPEVPATPSFVDVLSGRFSSTGATDTTFGNNGSTIINVAGFHDRCRAMEVLSDDSVLLVGHVNPVADNQQAALYLLQSNGQRNINFDADGVFLIEFGGSADALFGAAVSPDGKTAYAVGYKGFTSQSPAANDDARLVVIPLTPGGV